MTNPADRARVAEGDLARVRLLLRQGTDVELRLARLIAHERIVAERAAREAALREERSRAAEIVRSCKPPVVDWTTQFVRQQLDAIAEIILNPAPPPPPTKGTDAEK